ncbi:lipopolysaccharide biosynthesis protein [Kocuria sp. p3-SID1433]|uniref:lipopolysaccharide biosynthesis protein n=1 Tax=unclassified Kocuria TaxID=2649579 RepID=UPI0021A8926C|nr:MULTISPECIES: lipopolysaccharide biosynthesis protein [unclassified Kocuria]MCT1602132.1 lipopolysaccharide biosynthesis protein [Kocuria sp. p3-SID1428]MCT2179613.1 lipopolysaccharide biosynthesis protein [Kocuria sp. p3-SID1433]
MAKHRLEGPVSGPLRRRRRAARAQGSAEASSASIEEAIDPEEQDPLVPLGGGVSGADDAEEHVADGSGAAGHPDPEGADDVDDTSADTGSERLGQNILWNYLSGFTSIFGLLLLYPLAVSIVGAPSYGLWVLAIGAIQMLTMTDFGLGSGIVRTLTGIAEGPSAPYERRRFVTAAVLVFVLLGAVLTAGYLAGFPLYLRAVDVSPQDQHAIIPMTVLAGCTLFVSMVGRGLNSVLWGLNRPDIERKAAVVSIILRALGYLAVLFTDAGLLGIVVVECASLMLPPIVCLWAVWRRFRAPVLDRGLWADHGAPLLRLSSVMSIGSLALLGVYQLPLFIVGPTLGLAAATAFGALMRVYQSCRLIVSWIAMPYGYPLRVTEGQRASTVLKSCTTLTLGIGMLMGVALLTIPTELMTAWMGDDFAFAAMGLATLTIGLIAEALNQPASLVMTLRGSALRASLINLAILVLTLPAVWFATRTGDIEWVILGTVAPSLLLSGFQLRGADRDLPYRVDRQDAKRWSGMLAGVIAYGGVALLIAHFLPTWPTILLVGAGLAVMAVRMMRTVRHDGELVAEAAQSAEPASEDSHAAAAG